MKSTVKEKKKRGIHPNSLANLEKRKKFQKGQPSANPKGRPCNELSLTNIAREKLQEPCPYDPEGRTWAKYLVDRWFGQCGENVTYFRELIDRLEGKVTQPIGGEGGQAIDIRVTYDNGSKAPI